MAEVHPEPEALETDEPQSDEPQSDEHSRTLARRVLARLLRLSWPSHPRRWADLPEAVRPTLTSTARLTVAAVIAFALTVALGPGKADLTGPLTALLVLQASAVSTLKMGLVRVGAVLSGVLIAITLSNWIGLTWWSLGLAIAAALLVGKIFRLGAQALETPISAMLILAVGTSDVAAETRILNTLIGAGVGITFGLLFPVAMQTPAARRSVVKVAEATASPLTWAARVLSDGPPRRDQAEGWLAESRAAVAEVGAADQRLATLRDSRRFNPRALGTRDIEPVLASAVQTLERCLLAVRALFVAMLAELPADQESGDQESGERGSDESWSDDPAGDELRRAFGALLADTGQCLRAFGALVVAEAEGDEAHTERATAENVEILRETRAFLTELILVDAQGNNSAWLMHGAIVAAVDQVLSELDVEERLRARQLWQETEQRRRGRPLPPLIEGVLPHPERPYPRAVDAVIDQLRQGRLRGQVPYSSYLEPKDEPPPDDQR